MRLNQVKVAATDFDESVAFYVKLGLRLIVSSRGESARFELPERDATFSVHSADSVSDDEPLLYFEVDDVDATFRRLRAEGIAFAASPETQPWLWREARLTDPSGNRLCIFNAGQNRRYPPWRVEQR